jgi:hypothetical protein
MEGGSNGVSRGLGAGKAPAEKDEAKDPPEKDKRAKAPKRSGAK